MEKEIFTIGHSTHELDYLISLLIDNSITLVCDVRSNPYSQYNPQFNRESFKEQLNQMGIKYHFLGHELGGRTNNPNFLEDDRVQYNLLAKTEKFTNGIKKLIQLARDYQVVLMCSEKDPLTCHRAILVGRQLKYQNVDVYHILDTGEIEDTAAFEERLLETNKFPINMDDMFRSNEESIEQAYDIQSQKIAYVIKENKDDQELYRE